MITRVAKVYLEVDDQSAGLEFWTDKMGFRLVTDERFGDERWIEVQPPHQDLLLVLTRRRTAAAPREVSDNLPHSNVFFDCDDIEKTHRELVERGVRFTLAPSRQHFGCGACSRTTNAPGSR
jgi:catechol 2,3-dioxygenase-like lactoylglutathione lyase family enzyme